METCSSDYLAGSGFLDLSRFRMTDPESDTLITLGHFHLGIDSLHTLQKVFDFEVVSMEDIFTKFEYFKNGDNFSTPTRLLPS